MNVRTESRDQYDLLVYAGAHACKAADDEQDRRVHEYLERRVAAGQRRFMFDVRELRLVFGSSMGGLFNSWAPTRAETVCRVAILWKPGPGSFDRWRYYVGQWVGLSKSGHALMKTTVYFVAEDEAREFLLADES